MHHNKRRVRGGGHLYGVSDNNCFALSGDATTSEKKELGEGCNENNGKIFLTWFTWFNDRNKPAKNSEHLLPCS